MKTKKLRNRKILLFVLSILIVLISTCVGGTMAYMNVLSGIDTNVITAGSVELEIDEWMTDEDNERVPFENQRNVYPGHKQEKIVEIRNVGTAPAWIRVKVEPKFDRPEKETPQTALFTPDPDVIKCNFNTKDWEYFCGYYYYDKVLEPDEVTTPLFTYVLFDGENVTNEYMGYSAHVVVSGESVQSSHNGDSALEAAGWPTD